MLNFNSILLSSEHPEKLRDFYGKILDKKPDMNKGGYYGFLIGQCFLTIGPHDKVKGKNSNPERMIYNFESKHVKDEFKRIKDLGARVIAEPYQMGGMSGYIATFADPDGNFFQLLPPWKMKE
jgi:predicted enzyme related to lactoylglutathione lyase